MDAVTIDAAGIRKGGNMDMVAIDATAIRNMVENALAFCAQKVGLRDGEGALDAIHKGDCSACSYLKYGLSKEIGRYLGGINTSVQAVYTYEPEYSTGVGHLYGAQPALERGINLIIAVDRKSAALSSIIAALEDALSEAREHLVCSKANGSCCALDVKVADKEEVASRRGYGALISSIYARPLRVWARED